MSDERRVTRSTAATTAAARVSRERLAQPSGWWGMAGFLSAEATVFGTMMGTYFYLDFEARRWPPAGIKAPSVVLPFIGTGALVAMIVPLFLAARSARAGRPRAVMGLMGFAVVVQCCYLALQILLFRHDLRQFTPEGSAYGSIYFTLLATHHAHVLLGILLELGVMAFVALRGLTNYWLIGVRSVVLYWYVVNALAVFVVFTQLAPSL